MQTTVKGDSTMLVTAACRGFFVQQKTATSTCN